MQNATTQPPGDTPEEISANLRQAFLELELYRAGKLPLRTAAEVLAELEDAPANPAT